MKKYLIILLIALTTIACEKYERVVIVKTGAVSNISSVSATLDGTIIDAGIGITAYGHCWSVSNQNPTPNICDGKTELGSNKGKGVFSSQTENLQAGTTYYVAAYATSANESATGKAITFTTLASVPPTAETSVTSNITQTTVSLNGNINANGASSAVSFEYGTSTNYGNIEIATPSPVTGTSNTPVSANISGLSGNTIYHYRVKAVSTSGTSFGSDLIFTTSPLEPSLTTKAISGITQTSAESGGNITSDGGGEVTARGVCYNTSGNPTITDIVTINGTGAGLFTSAIAGLTANKTYYVRAYAINNAGTAYGNELSFKTKPSGEIVTDVDGNEYTTVTIGTQIWMVENLKTTKYRDGTSITLVTDPTAWTTSGAAYCWYNNDAATYKATYGALYNWYAVDPTSNGGKNICPVGWHVPTDAEWITLFNYLGGETVAGGKMKATGTIEAGTGLWYDPNTGASNSSGFTAIPGGSRGNSDGTFFNVGNYGFWWSSNESDSSNAWFRNLYYSNADAYRIYGNKQYGFSVRCLRD